jgi:Pvc16 N-terminal domain
MAGFGAIQATSAAILGLLESAADGSPEFRTTAFVQLTSGGLQASGPDAQTVSLYLYHLNVNAGRRSAGSVDAFGARRLPPLRLDLHYLLTAWAKDAGTQQRLLGWAVRTLADTATLPAGVLNGHSPDPVFRPDETVELVWENLSQQDLFDIWDVARPKQQPSAAYVARILELESPVTVGDFPLVQTTDIQYGAVVR